MLIIFLTNIFKNLYKCRMTVTRSQTMHKPVNQEIDKLPIPTVYSFQIYFFILDFNFCRRL